MSKRPATLIVLDRNKRESLQTQLAVSLKDLVQARVLAPGEAVPSSRELAAGPSYLPQHGDPSL